MRRLRVLVCTVVHHPQDARILHRQIRAMLQAGYDVTYAAPFTAYDTEPWAEVTGVDLPRAVGRDRRRALKNARQALRSYGSDMDAVLLHDPELLLALPGVQLPGAVVWDVHEDTGAALVAKPWLPGALRPVVRMGVRVVESAAERRVQLMLAEKGYWSRFRRIHPVVPNTTYVPETVVPPGDNRVVYVGHLTQARGVDTLVATAERLVRAGVITDVIGHGDAYARDVLRSAAEAGVLRWHGFLPSDKAMQVLDGALCGLSLLRDLPNYRHSLPTKMLEYMAHGVPVITTPLPSAVSLAQIHKCGVVVPYDDPDGTASAVVQLRDDAELRQLMGRRGHRAARVGYHWPDTAQEFLTRLERWADAARSAGQTRRAPVNTAH